MMLTIRDRDIVGFKVIHEYQTLHKRFGNYYVSVQPEYKVIFHYLDPKCPGDLVYSNCHSACPLHCNEPEPEKCITLCVPGCGCPSGLYRDGDRCYKKDDCPISPDSTLKTI